MRCKKLFMPCKPDGRLAEPLTSFPPESCTAVLAGQIGQQPFYPQSSSSWQVVSVYGCSDGFTEIPLTEANFVLQKPYDTPPEERYSYENGVHKMWVYADDKPLALGSNTQPRTEIRNKGLDYCSGVWQFEGNSFVPNGTSGATIVQIFGAAHGNTTMLLRIYNGEMRYYSYELVDATNLYDKWLRVNLIHNVDGGLDSASLLTRITPQSVREAPTNYKPHLHKWASLTTWFTSEYFALLEQQNTNVTVTFDSRVSPPNKPLN
ncbi:unnamed protein product [Ilex paraguariensis]|uniref:Alginate lyase 2 domain-containing protein n=1 Tax=Ilex paraguariensis TaxID=185542 RepID=A0ABC8QSR9_9AQUA